MTTRKSRQFTKRLDAGITCFDTAAGYGLGHSEELLGRALSARRKDIVVVTKCGIAFNTETNQSNATVRVST